MKIKYAIFDMDGTVTNSNGVWAQAVYKYIDDHAPYKREDIPEVFWSEIILGGTMESLEYLRDTMGDDTDFGDIMRVIMANIEIGYAVPQPLKKGVVPFLERLRASGADICMISATPLHLVEKALKLCGIREYFDFVISAEDRKSGKDKPYVFMEAAARMNCDASECTLFEDAIYSLRTGKKLGMQTVGIKDYYCKPEVWDEIVKMCDIAVDDYSDITIE